MRAGFLLATSVRSFLAPARFSAEGKKLFTRDTARNCRAKLTSCLGEKQDPARCPGTRNPGAARRRGGGDGARPEPPDLARPTGARTRSSAGLGRTRPPPPQPRRAGIVSSAPAAPCARPAPTARSRSRPAAQAGRRRSVGQSDRPARSLRLALEPSGLPAAVPALASVLLPRGRGGAVSSGARGPAPGAQVASRAAAPPSLEREPERGGEAEERERRRRTRAGPGWREFLPHRPRRQQRHRPGG